MSVYVRELLFDLYESRRLSVEERCDIELALRAMLARNEITPRHIQLLRLYLSGYTIFELEHFDQNIRSILLAVLHGIERETRYRDEQVVDMGLSRYPKLARIRQALLRRAQYLSLDLERYNISHF